MQRSIALFLTVAATWLASAAEFRFGNYTFTLPDGFEMERVAGAPLVSRPIGADFDEQGRLYVTDSSGSSERADKQIQEKSHRMVRLEDSDGDGRFDRTIVFADKLMFPEGVLWFEGAVYCGAPPTIWKLEDTDGDGVSDQRSEWYKGETLTGCANDLHGPYLGPDGYIYWCKGAFAKQTHARPRGRSITDSAAHIFRCKPDGSEFDSVMSGGMDNPVEIAFTRTGDAIFTTTFFVNPEAGRRDAIVHAVYGSVFPKVHGVLDGVKRTGDLMPPLTHLGPAVPSGLMRYTSHALGDDFTDNLFSTQFNLHKVQRHILEPSGGSFRMRDLDFLTCDNPDFHPTDVLEDAEGSLLVLDTGGWYRICCPSAQIAKPEVLGAIYRIRRTGAPKINDPRGLKLAWSEMKAAQLVKLLDDERPAVRNRAIAQLAKHGAAAVRPLQDLLSSGKGIPKARPATPKNRSATRNVNGSGAFVTATSATLPQKSRGAKPPTVEARRNAVWALTRIDVPAARTVVRIALNDSDSSVQQVAAHSTGLHRDAAAVSQLIELLQSSSPHLQRTAAMALGQIGDNSAVAALLSSTRFQHDRVMEHALIYALIEIADREPLLKVVNQENHHVPRRTAPGSLVFQRRAALIALDQMDSGDLPSNAVVPLLNSPDPTLKETATWITSHHPDWGNELTGFFQQKLNAAADLPAPERDELQKQLGIFARDNSIQNLIATTFANRTAPVVARELTGRAMSGAALKEVPAAWKSELHRALDESDERILRQAVATLRAWPAPKTNATEWTEQLLRIARNARHSQDLRLQALSALPAGLLAVEQPVFDLMRASLDPVKAPIERSTAATVLGRAQLASEQLETLADSVRTAGPLELPKLLGAFANVTSEALATKLIAALKASQGLGGLRPDILKPLFAKFPASVQPQGNELLEMLNQDAAKQKARLDELSAGLAAGDKSRGHHLFNSPKTACVTCHAIGYVGGKVGPDLTRIGSVRTERDLLESIVYPSTQFVRSYEPIVVRIKNGEEYSGIVRQESSENIILVTGAGAEQRLATSDVAEMRPGVVSVMPSGLDEQLSRQEVADLIAFLKSLK